MKKILFCFSLLAMSATMIYAQSAKTHTWTYTITPNTTHKAVDSLVADWKTHKLDLRFYNAKYDDKGRLVSFEGSVNNNNGKGHCSAKFSNEDQRTITITLTDEPSVSVTGK